MRKKKKNTVKNKPTLVAVLLDRTGSMSECKEETISGYNAFVNKLREEKSPGMLFTLTQFDSMSIDTMLGGVPIAEAYDLNVENFTPRAWTPLYDAIGRTIKSTEQKAGKEYKVLFMVLTDGYENASKEWTLEGVRKLIKEKEGDDHWTFTYVGIGPDAWAAGRSIYHDTVSIGNVMNFKDKKDISKVMRRAGGQTVSYACSTQGVNSVSADYWAGSGLKSEDDDK